MRTTRLTVGKWRSRFVAQRMEGLYDEPRPGASRKIGDDSDRGGRDEDAGDDSKGKNSLEYALYGQTSWAEPFDDWTYLADVRASTAPLGIVSSLARPTTCRKGARRCWPVHEPTGQRGRPVRRREISDSSARTRPTRFADELGPARASDSWTTFGTERPTYLHHSIPPPARSLGSATRGIERWSSKSSSLRSKHAVPNELDSHIVLDNLATHKTPAIKRWLAKRPRFPLPLHANSRIMAEPCRALLWLAHRTRLATRLTHQCPSAQKRPYTTTSMPTTTNQSRSSGPNPPTKS